MVSPSTGNWPGPHDTILVPYDRYCDFLCSKHIAQHMFAAYRHESMRKQVLISQENESAEKGEQSLG